jgi:hypothetical protein
VTGANGTFTLLVSLGVNVTGHGDTPLQPKTEYCYKVRSFKTTGSKRNYGAFSNTACATTWGEPPAPAEIYAKPTNSTDVLISWLDTSAVETGFRLETSASADGPWSLVVKTAQNVSSHIQQRVAVEQPLCYRVIAFNSVGDSPSSPVKCTALPAHPTDLTAKAADAQSIDIGWKDNSAFEDGYEIQRSLDGYGWTILATLPANAINHRDQGLTANTRYWYRLRALKDAGSTPWSSAVSGVPIGGPPPAPPSISASATGANVSIYWTSSGPSAEGYRVERSPDGVSGWTIIATVPATWGAVSDLDRTLEQRVCYRVIAFNGLFGDSPPSSTSCLTPLAAPTDFAAAPAGNGAIDLTWTDVSQANTDYNLEILRTYYGGYYGYYEWWEFLTSAGGDVTTYRVEGLDPSQFHQFRVIASSGASTSEPSGSAGSLTDSPPAAPSNLSAMAISSGRIDLVWSDNSSDETYFTIERCEGTADICLDDYFSGLRAVPVNVTTYSDASVVAGTTYTYRVRAYQNAAASDPTNKAEATTPAPPEE